MLPVVTALLPIVSKVIDRVIPNVAEREKVKLELQVKLAEQEGELIKALTESDIAQAKINEADAQSSDKFKSYPRPAALWICVIGLAWTVFLPVVSWIIKLSGYEVPDVPQLGGEVLTTLTFGLLGLGGLRTYEKKVGVTK